MKTNTRLLHDRFAGDKANTGATLTPIYQTSAFGNATAEGLEAIFQNRAAGYAYTRIGNPTIASFEQRMNALEQGTSAVAFASGMAAITSLCLAVLSAGDEIVASAGVFGGTIGLFADLQQFGITTRYVDACTPEALEQVVTPKTRLVFAEIIGNPRLDVLDVPAVSRYLRQKGNILFVWTIPLPHRFWPGCWSKVRISPFIPAPNISMAAAMPSVVCWWTAALSDGMPFLPCGTGRNSDHMP